MVKFNGPSLPDDETKDEKTIKRVHEVFVKFQELLKADWHVKMHQWDPNLAIELTRIYFSIPFEPPLTITANYENKELLRTVLDFKDHELEIAMTNEIRKYLDFESWFNECIEPDIRKEFKVYWDKYKRKDAR